MVAMLRDWLWDRTWWSYRPDDGGYTGPYHWFNLFEGSVWIFLAGLVLLRYLHYRHSTWELLYSFAFVLFGLSDFREAYALQSWLIWAKGINLLGLYYLRRLVIGRYYPNSRLY